jgi:AcrR family transcriptional regulator
MEAIAAEAHVARTRIYRRWPNKATVIMDAFLAEVGPGLPFPSFRARSKVYDRRVKVRIGAMVSGFTLHSALRAAPCFAISAVRNRALPSIMPA